MLQSCFTYNTQLEFISFFFFECKVSLPDAPKSTGPEQTEAERGPVLGERRASSANLGHFAAAFVLLVVRSVYIDHDKPKKEKKVLFTTCFGLSVQFVLVFWVSIRGSTFHEPVVPRG